MPKKSIKGKVHKYYYRKIFHLLMICDACAWFSLLLRSSYKYLRAKVHSCLKWQITESTRVFIYQPFVLLTGFMKFVRRRYRWYHVWKQNINGNNTSRIICYLIGSIWNDLLRCILKITLSMYLKKIKKI